LQSEVETAIKVMKDQKATGDDDVLQLMSMVTQLTSNVHYTGDWPRDVTELSMTVLQKKPTTTKYSDHPTISRDSSEDT